MSMRIRTFSIVAGSMACNASCPFCIAGMTPENGLGTKEPEINWRNFRKACHLAGMGGCTTVMITGKGEPTIFPDQITQYLQHMSAYEFPIIEMQTNGILIAGGVHVTDDHLKSWYELGLTTVAISVVHYDPEKNRQIYLPKKSEYIDLPALIKKLHDHGFSVRLTTIMARGFLDSAEELSKMLAFASANRVEQLTCTPVTKPDASEDQNIYNWTAEHALSNKQFKAVKDFVFKNGSLLQNLPHGARIYNMPVPVVATTGGALPVLNNKPATRGQNLCLSNCITVDPDAKEMRSIIFFPDGHVRTAWQYEGSILF